MTCVVKYVNFVYRERKSKRKAKKKQTKSKRKKKKTKRSVFMKIYEDICSVRKKLGQQIEDGKDDRLIYNTSIELDELIATYYNIYNRKQGQE